MQSDRAADKYLDFVMTYLFPFSGAALICLILLQRSTLPPWAAYLIGLPTGITAGWAVTVVLLILGTIVTRRI